MSTSSASIRTAGGVSPPATGGRILLAGDNSGMRDYIRLLEDRYEVAAVADGEAALESIRRDLPDLVLAEVTMPRLDGFGLVSAIRADPKTATIQVILVAAADEEGDIEGIKAAADDYLVKPFSAPELLARVASQLSISQLRKQAAENGQALRHAAETERQRWRDLLLQTPTAICLLSGPNHVFDAVNPVFLRLINRPTDKSLLGRPIVEAIPELAGQAFIDPLDDVYRTGLPFLGNEMSVRLDLQGDGILEDVYVTFIYVATKDVTGNIDGVMGKIHDVTGIVKARHRLEESETRFRTLTQSIPQLVWTCSPAGECDYLSEQWVSYTGIPAEQQLGLQWLEMIHPEDRESTHRAWIRAVQDLAPYDLEYRLRRHDGIYRWFKTRGTPLRNAAGEIQKWFGTCTDIEEQKQSEAERQIGLAREQEARRTAELLNLVGPTLSAELDSQKLTQKITDIATELTGAQFGALFHNVVNQQGESYLLYTLSGVPREAFSKFPNPRNTEVFAPTFSGEGPVRSDDITKDPRYGRNAPHRGMPEGHLPVRSYLAVPVVSRSGEVLGGLFFGHAAIGKFTQQHENLAVGVAAQAAIALDNARLFTQITQTKAALEISNEELHRVNEDLERFAYSASHDLQEPLRMVSIFTELLKKRYAGKLGPDADTYIAYAIQGARRMEMLIRDLLAYTYATTAEIEVHEPLDLNFLFDRVVATLQGQVEQCGAVITRTDLPAAWIHEVHAHQLFQNLLSNAIKYRSNNVPQIRVSVTKNSSAWLFSVQDNGIGIDPQYTQQIFGIFKRLHNKDDYDGTGIGLAICERIVERYGGRIWVESEAGKGANFLFTIPFRNAAGR